MTATLRRTPCVGICSTTYGDLVCRGCKRFAHEIDQWNGYQDEQRQLVWMRLYRLREGSVRSLVSIQDRQVLRARAEELRVPDLEEMSDDNVAYEVIRRAGALRDPGVLGLGARVAVGNAAELFRLIEEEFYRRAEAQYEHDFHVLSR